MNHEDHITVEEFTSEDWNGNASFSVARFIASSFMFGILGSIVALILMIFLPDMRNPAAVMLFSTAFGLIFGLMFQLAQRTRGKIFLSDVSTKINVILAELGRDESQTITPEQLKELIEADVYFPFTVEGIAGMYLVVREHQDVDPPLQSEQTDTGPEEPQEVVKAHSAHKRWQILIAAEAPQYATESFDRLLDAATRTDITE
ncbi:hypothetical protein [Arthrobacter bussei]|uniref:Uncharacterized protein n=1 Tax=Arthrobacter bussei TaxID=2594179 RepID=A0A7X1NSC8_9MICC|nr:hypothetical protein [Arthrobacter bussei]MPY12105.1 hypothetical protein [Arthrobacter bussei]